MKQLGLKAVSEKILREVDGNVFLSAGWECLA